MLFPSPDNSGSSAQNIPTGIPSPGFQWLLIFQIALFFSIFHHIWISKPLLPEALSLHEEILMADAAAPQQYHLLIPSAVDFFCRAVFGVFEYKNAFLIVEFLLCFAVIFFCTSWLLRLLLVWFSPLLSFCGILLFWLFQALAFSYTIESSTALFGQSVFFAGILLLERLTSTAGDERRKAHVFLLVTICIGLLNNAFPLILVFAYILLALPQKKPSNDDTIPEMPPEQTERPFAWLTGIPVDMIYEIVRNEHPQTLAVVLAHLEPDRGATLLERLPDDLQKEVARRLGEMEPVQDDILIDLDRVLKSEIKARIKAVPSVSEEKRSTGSWGWVLVYLAAAAAIYFLPRYGLGVRDRYYDWAYYLDRNLRQLATLYTLTVFLPLWIAALWNLYRKPWFMRRLFPAALLYLLVLLVSTDMSDSCFLTGVLALILPSAVWTLSKGTQNCQHPVSESAQ